MIGPLVTLSIVVHRDGRAESDVQTHDNSYAEVAEGLAGCRDEIARVFAEAKDCPHYPRNAEEANRKIVRAALSAPRPLVAEPPAAWAASDWMRSITETELASIPNTGANFGRRDHVRSMYPIALYAAPASLSPAPSITPEPDFESRAMFVARLENMEKNGDRWLTVNAVLALLNDCDMLASRPAPDASSTVASVRAPAKGER